jgi:hypothetical protein
MRGRQGGAEHVAFDQLKLHTGRACARHANKADIDALRLDHRQDF